MKRTKRKSNKTVRKPRGTIDYMDPTTKPHKSGMEYDRRNNADAIEESIAEAAAEEEISDEEMDWLDTQGVFD